MIKFEKDKYFESNKFNVNCLKLNLKFNHDTKLVYGEYVAHEYLEGPPNVIHAGIIASILDESMMSVNKFMDLVSIVVEMKVRYLNTAFINENLYIRGWYITKNKNVIENRAEIENEIGKIVARATGKYMLIDDDSGNRT